MTKIDMRKIKKIWENLSPEKKKRLILLSVIGTLLVGSLVLWKIKQHSYPPVNKNVEVKKKDISLEPKLLEKSQYSEMQKSYKEIQDNIKKMDERMSSFEAGKTTPDKTGAVSPASAVPASKDVPSPPSPVPPSSQQKTYVTSFPPPPQPNIGSFPPPGVPPGQETRHGKVETYGEIEVVSQRIESKEDKKEDKKKDLMKVYLPPSFMEATLLSGLDAPTSEGSQGHPAPVIVRIKDLAVLPNKVKANLKGCFLIAEGYGNLSDERAHLRLANLSCLSKKGQAVIDQKVKGFVVDSDGKIGLRGRVVAKFGSKIAMGLIAGFFGGLGDGLKTSATTTNISTLGATQVIDTDQALKSGIGGGLSQAAKEIQKFYLDLSKQSMPVVEIGAMKNITVVISEGAMLEIKERENVCIGGRECEK